MILKGKKILESFTKKNCKIKSKKIRVEKVIKRKGDLLFIKWKGCESFFNSWIDKEKT